MNLDVTQIVSKYLNAWNETDDTRRRVAVAALCTDDCEYTDPLASVRGPSALDQLIAGVQHQLPGFKFSLAGKVDSHHDQARFAWQAAPEGAPEPVVVGFDVILLAAGRIRSVYGFLDKVPG
ncbi:MAG TPA: nuclear transport factor 2 family protein [Polyangiaceae bacterium]|nr:nuclear transport factor 2 family protein [Polyangiaceae bacterium]